MKTIVIFQFLLLYLISHSCAQSLPDMIEGTWKFSENMDCPDILTLKSDGIYQVLNDCGAQKPGLPVIEKGNWSFIKGKEALKLENREFVSPNSVFSEYHGRGEILLFFIKAVSEDELILCFGEDDNDCIEERYLRYVQSTGELGE